MYMAQCISMSMITIHPFIVMYSHCFYFYSNLAYFIMDLNSVSYSLFLPLFIYFISKFFLRNAFSTPFIYLFLLAEFAFFSNKKRKKNLYSPCWCPFALKDINKLRQKWFSHWKNRYDQTTVLLWRLGSGCYSSNSAMFLSLLYSIGKQSPCTYLWKFTKQIQNPAVEMLHEKTRILHRNVWKEIRMFHFIFRNSYKKVISEFHKRKTRKSEFR